MYDENYLAHYGILGQKWGVRRFQPYSVRGRKSGESGKEVGEARKHSKAPSKEDLLKSTDPNKIYKYRDQLSDKELRERVNRIQTEQQLKDLMQKNQKKQDVGTKATKDIMSRVGKMAAAAISIALFNYGKNKVISMWNTEFAEVTVDDIKNFAAFFRS